MRFKLGGFDLPTTGFTFVLLSALLVSCSTSDGSGVGAAGGGGGATDAGPSGAGGAGGTGGTASPQDAMAAGTGGATPTIDAAGTDAAGTGGAPVVMGSLKFTRKDLHRFNYAEAVGIGDFNGDGKPDVHSSAFWWEGPAFDIKHQFAPMPANLALTAGSNGDWANYEADVDGDGWLDSINITRPGTTSYWYKNPGKPMVDAPVSMWARSVIGTLALEQWVFTDLLGTGKKQLVAAITGRFGWFDVEPRSPWTFTAIAPLLAPAGFPWWHGIGTGDLDGDGRQDLLTAGAWYTTPEGGPRSGWWVAHQQRFRADGVGDRWGPSDMFGYDVDGDGDQDVVAALDSHAYGLAWFENNKGAFTRHVIVGGPGSMAMNAGMIAPFSQPHAMVVADVDGDGLKDIVAGKSFYAHTPGMGDPDTDGTPVIYVFKLVRGASGITWQPFLVDSQVGLGRQFAVGELNGDGKVDLAVCSKHGVFVFFQQ